MLSEQKQILAKLPQLPTLPAVVQEVIANFNNADLNTAWLANKIAQDQGLSVKVLRLANSSFYGLSRHVASIQDAITVMGFNSVRSIVLSAGVVQAFPAVPDSLFNRQTFWQRSFRVATISKALAQNLKLDNSTAFTAGMFHDIGQLILDLCMPQRFAEVLLLANERKNLIEIERSMLGFDHAELGAEVVRMWNFPLEFEQVVRYVHQPEQLKPFTTLVSVVHMAMLLDDGIVGEELMDCIPKDFRDGMQLTWKSIESNLPQADQLQAAADLASAS